MRKSDSSSAPSSSRRYFGLFAGLALLLLVTGAVWYFVVVRPAEAAAQSTLSRVENFLGGLLGGGAKVTRLDSSSLLAVNEVGELALMEFDLKVNKEIESEAVVLGPVTSTKRLRMEGRFKVKIGYDIEEGITVGYDEEGRAVIAGIGEPQVLSAEMISVNTIEDKSGIWNKVDERDRDGLVNQLRLQAIRDVQESGMLEQLNSLMAQNMKALLGVDDLVVADELLSPVVP
ncbi:DUF4230 domain-containing protein [Roseibacillus ishigakijimensis]|uniref:DUF4230 domain-containing protein n=1 Tax=Roseibacillus ishigakijimensis TaxID=454146 RepID=A0A934RV95_9BACT|nr:DUF4230 domain-containing protein [Roseibacillus ishigakijimensis]MBK1835101.1 DUF4230 domain-containing protein [Roseibacillus ishigakijimensis]